MTAQRIKKLTVEEYVALERSTNTKYEYHDGEVFALAGGSFNHSILCSRIHSLFDRQLQKDKRNCEALTSEMKLRIEKHEKYFYPDAMVVCGEFKQPESFEDAITNPIVIVEVLSESTEANDRGEKFHQYSSISTFQEYLLISQYKPVVEVFYRKPKTETWQINRYEGLETTFYLQSLKIDIELKTLYKRVIFEDDTKKLK